MHFHIQHTTEYVYSAPATEAFSELRLRPLDSQRQSVSRHVVRLEPRVRLEEFRDYFGNHVAAISIPFRHERLVATSECDVVTRSLPDVLSGLSLTLSEARMLYAPRRRELFDFLQPSARIPFNAELRSLAIELLPEKGTFAETLRRLNNHLFTEFKYIPGATDVGTTVPEFLKQGAGVCQDFAHLMICLLRLAGVPARYVSGYIETDPAPNTGGESEPALIGATASHAWVEAFAPNGYWVWMDPTNGIFEGERHVQIAVARDYQDVPPMKGVFKGANAQRLSVSVRVQRNGDAAAAQPA
jgi:transglutaminase-like putative cysteine protease